MKQAVECVTLIPRSKHVQFRQNTSKLRNTKNNTRQKDTSHSFFIGFVIEIFFSFSPSNPTSALVLYSTSAVSVC